MSLFQHKSETCELGAKLYLYYNAKVSGYSQDTSLHCEGVEPHACVRSLHSDKECKLMYVFGNSSFLLTPGDNVRILTCFCVMGYFYYLLLFSR